MREGVNTAKIPYESRMLRWARRHHETVQMERRCAVIARELNVDLPEHPNASRASVPGDKLKLRGIPVVGVPGGVGGAIPGSKPGERL